MKNQGGYRLLMLNRSLPHRGRSPGAPGNTQNNTTQLFYCSPVLISRPWRDERRIMKNKPNLKTNIETKSKSEFCAEPKAKSRRAGSKAGNEPNTNRKLTTENRKSLHLFTRKMRTFAHKMKKMHAFCKYLKLTYLTPDISKPYMNIYPRIKLKKLYPSID
jgi:hypothetical protein